MRNRGLLLLVSFLTPTLSLANPELSAKFKGTTIVCGPSTTKPSYFGKPFQLKLVNQGSYHRDGLWFETEFNGPTIHTYTFISPLHTKSSGAAAGTIYDAFIQREVLSVHLEDVRGSSKPDKWPVGFHGTVVLPSSSEGRTVHVTCDYLVKP